VFEIGSKFIRSWRRQAACTQPDAPSFRVDAPFDEQIVGRENDAHLKAIVTYSVGQE
jgi:hypothetical protein